MKESRYSFAEGFLGMPNEERSTTQRAFDFDEAAMIIKEKLTDHPDLIAEAGLEGDWNFTGGEIFRDGKPVSDSYTYLSSNWATPTLILSWDGEEQESHECFADESERFHSDSKWDDGSLRILNS